MRTVLVFGTFDTLHPGHEYFLNEAKNLGDRLVVLVARDKVVRQLKGRRPVQNETDRVNAVGRYPAVWKAILGDEQMGTYTMMKTVKPDVIAIGYDQEALNTDLQSWLEKSDRDCQIVSIGAFKPQVHKSSLRTTNL